MTKRTITNISSGPRGAYLKGELVIADPGQSIETDEDVNKEWFKVAAADAADDEEDEKDPDVEVPTNDEIVEAIAGLDKANDDHWTQAGQPAVAVLGETLAYPKLTRAMVTAAAPDAKRPEAE